MQYILLGLPGGEFMAEYKGAETPRVYRSSEPGLPHFPVRRLKSLCDFVPILKDWEINTAGAEGSYLSANLVQPFDSKVVFIIFLVQPLFKNVIPKISSESLLFEFIGFYSRRLGIHLALRGIKAFSQ